MYYKDQDNNVHFLEDENFKHLLPENTVQITEEEATLIRNKTPLRATIDPVEEAKYYLYSTDWYIIRQQETGKAIPEEIAIKRKEAREKIN